MGKNETYRNFAFSIPPRVIAVGREQIIELIFLWEIITAFGTPVVPPV